MSCPEVSTQKLARIRRCQPRPSRELGRACGHWLSFVVGNLTAPDRISVTVDHRDIGLSRRSTYPVDEDSTGNDEVVREFLGRTEDWAGSLALPLLSGIRRVGNDLEAGVLPGTEAAI